MKKYLTYFLLYLLTNSKICIFIILLIIISFYYLKSRDQNNKTNNRQKMYTVNEIEIIEFIKATLLHLKKTNIIGLNDNEYVKLSPGPILYKKKSSNTNFLYERCLTEAELITFIKSNVESIKKQYPRLYIEHTSADIDKAIEIINKELLLRLKTIKEIQSL